MALFQGRGVNQSGTFAGSLGFGNPSSPSDIISQEGPRATDFWKNFPQGTDTTDPAYAGYLKTVGSRGKALWDAAQKSQPNTNYMPGTLDQWQSESGAMPTLRSYKDYPTDADAKPYMENLSGGMRSTLDELVRRQAGAGITRGGMGVAGGVPLDSSGRLNSMKTLAGEYGNIYNQGMTYAKDAADYDRRSALDTLAAEQEKAKFGYQQAKDYYAGLSDQEKLQLSKYGLDTNAAIQMLQQELSGLNAGQNAGMQKLGMQQSSWNKDVDYDNALRMRLMDLAGRGLGDGTNTREVLGSASPGRQATAPGPSVDQNVLRNMDETRGAQKNAQSQAQLQDFEIQRQINDYLKKYRSPALRQAPDYNQGFNYTPEDLRMAKLMGIQLPEQGKFQYDTKSQTGSMVNTDLIARPVR